jgi:polyhydroxyalkanoate synthesis regulator phasin
MSSPFVESTMRDLVQKALYLGVGIASYAAEKAGANLQELRVQAQKLADELVERGEMNLEEARRYVDDLVREAQNLPQPGAEGESPKEPRRIEIVFEDEPAPPKPEAPKVDQLRQQVEALQAELRRMKGEG